MKRICKPEKNKKTKTRDPTKVQDLNTFESILKKIYIYV